MRHIGLFLVMLTLSFSAFIGCGDPSDPDPDPPTGGAVCGNAVCESPENSVSCPNDCRVAPVSPQCGNGVCESPETSLSCSNDCRTAPIEPQCGNNRCEAGEGTSTCYTDCVPGGGDAVPATYTVSVEIFTNAATAFIDNRDGVTIYCSGRVYGYYPNGASAMIYWRGHNPVPVGGHAEVPVFGTFVNAQHTITCRKPAES